MTLSIALLPATEERVEDVEAMSVEVKTSRTAGEISFTFRGTDGIIFSALLNSIPRFLSFRSAFFVVDTVSLLSRSNISNSCHSHFFQE